MKPERNIIITADATRLLPTWPVRFVDLLVTDPPYGNNVAYGTAHRRIAGDEHPLSGLTGVAACYRLMKPNSTAYVFCAASHVGFMEHFFLKYSDFRLRELLIWNKQTGGFGTVFRGAYECILVLEKGKPEYQMKATPTVLTFGRASAKDHPHAKPVPLLERLITLSSKPGDLVLDPFAGTGSTLVASANLGRDYVGVEVDPHYAELARVRLKSEARKAA